MYFNLEGVAKTGGEHRYSVLNLRHQMFQCDMAWMFGCNLFKLFTQLNCIVVSLHHIHTMDNLL